MSWSAEVYIFDMLKPLSVCFMGISYNYKPTLSIGKWENCGNCVEIVSLVPKLTKNRNSVNLVNVFVAKR